MEKETYVQKYLQQLCMLRYLCKGNVTYKAVADTFGHKFLSPSEAIN